LLIVLTYVLVRLACLELLMKIFANNKAHTATKKFLVLHLELD
jgi:hypothetical protein